MVTFFQKLYNKKIMGKNTSFTIHDLPKSERQIRGDHEARRKAKELLEEAKRKVEEMIEKNTKGTR